VVYLGYNRYIDVACRKQVASWLDPKPSKPSTVGDVDDSRKALGSVTSEHPTNDHLHKKSIKVDK